MYSFLMALIYRKGDELRPLKKSLKRELEEGAEAIRRKQKEDIIKVKKFILVIF